MGQRAGELLLRRLAGETVLERIVDLGYAVIERASLPECLAITAWSDDGEIMGVRHRSLAIEGVQFHPESILSEHGHALLQNFLAQR